jgi:hypothetical protein
MKRGGTVATIRKRGPGGGKKVNRKRVSRQWLIKTVLAQQAAIEKLSEQYTSVTALLRGEGNKQAVLDSEDVSSMPVGKELAPSGTSDEVSEHIEAT